MTESPPTKRQKGDKEDQALTSSAHDFENFALSGDVTFIVQGETRVRVCSAILKTASPVFAVMLGPNFKEGHALAKADGTPVEIALPEDDCEPFGWICRTLHCQADSKLWRPEVDKLMKVWAIAEKYDMLKAIQLSVDFWVSELLKSYPTDSDLWCMALSCYRAKDSDSFRSITRQLILSCKDPYIRLASHLEGSTKEVASAHTMYKLAATLQEARSHVLSGFVDLLYINIPSILREYDCFETHTENSASRLAVEYHTRVVEDCTEVFGLYHLMGTDVNLAHLLDSISSLNRWFSSRCNCWGCALAVQEAQEEILNVLEQEIWGLCFACFDKAGNKACTSNHYD
ncbi:hypothetical protein FSARC_3894 [Fusarium sarcochroum]|uniref:BTB domain-containing protein n=1 Tax=Fusarium sarcochroum TaxID=1208366 RepID=A0A8H4XBY2_9HYPO|nr:hypothetical protein FSARC_3894 [Fusarium sarcochroum]